MPKKQIARGFAIITLVLKVVESCSKAQQVFLSAIEKIFFLGAADFCE